MNRLKTHLLGEHYTERLRVGRQVKEEARSRPIETWRVSGGDYVNSFFQDGEWDEKVYTLPTFDLCGAEVVFYELLKKKLKERKERGDQTPVVAVDIGGMYGVSWCRLAKHFEKEVVAGEIQFVVTNLANDNSNIESSFKAEMAADPIHSRPLEVFEQAHHLVQYKKMDVAELWEVYRGKVDLVHEKMSLTHSMVPDTDFPLAVECLNDSGVFVAGDSSSHDHFNELQNPYNDTVSSTFDKTLKEFERKYKRIDKSIHADATIWSKDENAGRYFRKEAEYPESIKYHILTKNNRQ